MNYNQVFFGTERAIHCLTFREITASTKVTKKVTYYARWVKVKKN